jgi:streptogramin lyase
MTGNPGFSPDGTSARLANLNHPRSVAVDSDGHVYIADLGNNRVRKIDRVNLEISTVAGNGDAGSADGMDGRMALTVPITPLAVTVGPDGAIMILEQTGDRIRQVDGAGRISTIFAGYDAPYSGGSPASTARTKIRGLTVDHRGHLWFVDAGNHVAQFIKSS